MELVGRAKRVRIYVNEGDVVHHKPVHLAILEFLRAHNTAGATVLRAIEGFGGSGQIHTTRVIDADWKLPIVIEWVEASERVAQLLPGVKQLVKRGLITVDDTEVVLFSPFPVRDLPTGLTAADAMPPEVSSVSPDAPVREVVETLLHEKAHGAVFVVENGAPIGVITSSDLVRRGGVAMRVDLLAALDATELHAELLRMQANPRTAREVMTARPIAVKESSRLVDVAGVMAKSRVKRVPVVNQQGHLAGVLRRHDLLRTVAEHFDRAAPSPPDGELQGGTSIERVMRHDVPTVHLDTPLDVVMQAVIATRLNCAVVVDTDRRPVGVVTDAELLDRVTPTLRPSALRSLMHRLPFSHPDPKQTTTEHRARATTAADLMTTELPVVPLDAPLATAIASSLAAGHELVAIVDADRRLVGMVDHADLLRGLVGAPASPGPLGGGAASPSSGPERG
jgi:CBS domain-containing protein/PII-like signaling protein